MKKSLIKYSYLFVIFILFSSCSENLYEQLKSDINAKDVQLSLDVKIEKDGLSSQTRALDEIPNEGTDLDYKVKDYWLLEYDETGKMIASAYKTVDGNAEEVKEYVSLKVPKGEETYHCVLLANTHDSSFSDLLEHAQTIDGLKNFGKKISTFNSLYNSSDLYMNDVKKITKGTTAVSFTAHRNVAKLTLELKNAESSNIIITSVQIRNVPERLVYADQLWNSDAAIGVATDCSYINFPVDHVYIQENECKSFVYYLPRNQKGTVNDTDVKNKTKNAPQNATFIEIYGINKADNSTLQYRFYPGKDMVSDFNICPNFHYTLPITIKAAGDATSDSRIEQFESSNCYMIDPRSTQQIHYLPINRINEFWEHFDENASHTIQTNTEWTADVIWSDEKDLISFWEQDGTENATAIGGQGFMPIPFKVKEKEGNVLIGVKKKGTTEYLWSWHLWITSYDPNVDSNCIYDSSDQDYYMDRNLGAMANSMNPEAYGFFYQYGRKDPIPHENIDGYSSNDFFSTSQDYEVSVEYPNKYIYTGSSDTMNWALTGNTSSNWNNPAWNSKNTKSIFDPSPKGWHVPEFDKMFNFFGSKIEKSSDESVAITDINGHKSYFPYTGGHNYSSINGSSSANGDGKHYVGQRFYFWSSTGDNSGSAHYITYIGGIGSSGNSKGYGLNIRCVRDKK